MSGDDRPISYHPAGCPRQGDPDRPHTLETCEVCEMTLRDPMPWSELFTVGWHIARRLVK